MKRRPIKKLKAGTAFTTDGDRFGIVIRKPSSYELFPIVWVKGPRANELDTLHGSRMVRPVCMKLRLEY